MTEKCSVSAEFQRRDMTPDAIAEMMQLQMRELVETYPSRDCLKSVLPRVARKMELTASQAKRLYYGEWRVIPAHIYHNFNAAYERHLQSMRERADHDAQVCRQLSEKWDAAWSDSSSPIACSSLGDAPGDSWRRDIVS